MLSEQQQRDGRPGKEEELRRHEDGQRHQQQLSQSGDIDLEFIRVFFLIQMFILIILNCQDLQDSASHTSSHSKLSNDSHSPDDCINFSSSELVSEIETIIEYIDTKYHNNIYLAMFSSAY